MRRTLSGAWLLVSMFLGAGGLAWPGQGAPPPPTPSLPAPSGPHRTGTAVFHFVDASRPDPVSREAGRFREIMVQVWYPAQAPQVGETAPYIPDGAVVEAMKKENYYSQPASVLDSWKLVRTHSVLKAPVEPGAGRFPLLVFSPGAGVSRSNYTALAEELASHGATVAVLDHPYEGITALPDGRILSSSQNAAAGDGSEAALANQVREDARDASLVLDRLTGPGDPATAWLARRIDGGRIGIIGHSIGGAVALEAALADRRFKACADLDGGPFGRVAKEGVRRPALILRSRPVYSDEELKKKGRTREQWVKMGQSIDSTWREIFAKDPSVPATLASLSGTGHMSFSDAPFVMPDTITRFGGEILEARRTFEIVSACLRTFFGQYLEDRPGGALGGLSKQFPALTIQTFGRP